jgi:two-component sensor histidine kinase
VPLAAVVAVLFLVALVLPVALKDRQDLFDTAATIAGSTAALLTEHAVGVFEQSDFVARDVVEIALLAGTEAAARNTTRSATHSAVADRLHGLLAAGPHIEAILLTDAEGEILVSTLDHDGQAPGIGHARPFRDLKAGIADVAIAGHPFTRLMGEPSIGILRPVRREGVFLGVAAVVLSTDQYRRFFERVDVGYPLSITLLRGDGMVLVREPPLPDVLTKPFPLITPAAGAGAAPASATERGVQISRGLSPLDGVERIFAMASQGSLNVHVVVGIEVAAVETRWRARALDYGAFFVSALVGIASLTLMGMVWARRERLARAELELANRTLESRVAERTAELIEANARLSGALNDKETLFREVHHRVKNNLQVVASLLRLQSMKMAPDIRRSFEDTLNRIHSMGMVHELLYRSNQPATLEFGEYLRALAASVVEGCLDDPGRVTVEVTAEPLALDLETAIPLGLLVNELLTNALKHAFPHGRRGRLTLTLYRRAETGLHLTVQDDGVGLPDPAAAEPAGIGLLLVRSLSTQLGASVQATTGPAGGALWSVDLPPLRAEAA